MLKDNKYPLQCSSVMRAAYCYELEQQVYLSMLNLEIQWNKASCCFFISFPLFSLSSISSSSSGFCDWVLLLLLLLRFSSSFSSFSFNTATVPLILQLFKKSKSKKKKDKGKKQFCWFWFAISCDFNRRCAMRYSWLYLLSVVHNFHTLKTFTME